MKLGYVYKISQKGTAYLLKRSYNIKFVKILLDFKMKKTISKNTIIDKLHRGFVYSCIGLTLYAGTYLTVHYYNYFTQVKPDKDQKSILDNQQLLAEGASPDSAPSLVA